jgi:hypothetical protein
MKNELNHPFFVYPRGFMSEYNEYIVYRQEVLRLYKFIDDLADELDIKHNSKDILVPFIIGSPMEDSLSKSYTSIENIFQYSQLFPNYINNFISHNSNKKFIQIIIISPDNIFSNDTIHIPYFTLYSLYDFVNTNPNEYTCLEEFFEIKVNIFNCPLPCIEKRNNLVSKYQPMIDGLKLNPYDIYTYKQNNFDINFINSFYSSLEKIFSVSVSNQKIKLIINSWVSFKNLYGYSENYGMFPNLLTLANKYNIIATEWDFIDNLTFTKIVSNYGTKNKNFIGCYINYNNEELPNPEQIIEKNLFFVNFNCEYFLNKINI